MITGCEIARALSCWADTVNDDSPLPRDVKASRPNWPRGQNFGLGLSLVTLGLGLGLGLGTLWSRPQAFGLGLEL